MKVLQRIEDVAGTGSVTREDGSLVRRMDYDINVYQEFDHGLAGLRRIEGSVRLDGFAEAFDLVGESLTLHLDDGRILDFFVVNSNGKIANRSNRFGSSSHE